MVWRDGETFFRHAVAVNPNSWMAWSNLANAISDRWPDEAIAACRRSIALKPDYAFAYNNLGSMANGDHAGGLEAFESGYFYAPDDPTIAANYNRAVAETSTRPTTRP